MLQFHDSIWGCDEYRWEDNDGEIHVMTRRLGASPFQSGMRTRWLSSKGLFVLVTGTVNILRVTGRIGS
jgi:hypothetical protein